MIINNIEQRYVSLYQLYIFLRVLVETYGDNFPTQDACLRWFRRLKNGDLT